MAGAVFAPLVSTQERVLMSYTEQVRQESAAREILCELLNERKIRPIVDEQWFFNEIDEDSQATLGWERVELDTEELAALGLKQEDVVIEEHPDGVDLGGYVVYAGLARFDSCCGDWV